MPKSAGGTIITLVVLAAGIRALTFVGERYASDSSFFSDSVNSFLGLADIMFYGVIAIILVLIPYWISKRSKKKEGKE